MRLFIGHRLALGLNDLSLAGVWRTQPSRISFSWAAKRARQADRIGRSIATFAMRGSYGLRSEPYDPDELIEFQRRQLEDEAMPDFVPWGNGGE